MTLHNIYFLLQCWQDVVTIKCAKLSYMHDPFIIPLKTTNSSISESLMSVIECFAYSNCRIYQQNYYENLQLTLTVEISNVRILVQLSGLQCWECKLIASCSEAKSMLITRKYTYFRKNRVQIRRLPDPPFRFFEGLDPRLTST